MNTARVILAALSLAASISAPRAADYPGAIVVVAPPRVVVVAPPLQVWQGHFTGGRNLAPGFQPTALDWIDVTERFASLRECGRWMHALKRQYSTYEGWKGCLRIR